MTRSTNFHRRASVANQGTSLLFTSFAAGIFLATSAAAQPAATTPPVTPPALGALSGTPSAAPQPPAPQPLALGAPAPQPPALGAPYPAPPPLPPGAALPAGQAYPYPYPYAPSSPPGGLLAAAPSPLGPAVATESTASSAAKSTGPYTLPYYEEEPAPPGYRLVKRTNTAMAIAGGSTLGGLWLVSVLTGAALEDGSGNDGEFLPLMLPLVGPFVTLGTADPNVTGGTALVLDGIGQCVAGGLFISGLVTKRPLWVRDTLAVTVAPLIGGAAHGVAFEGRF